MSGEMQEKIIVVCAYVSVLSLFVSVFALGVVVGKAVS